jgi:hypothetical protein
VVFVNSKHLFVANPDGSEIRRLATAPRPSLLGPVLAGWGRLRFTVFSNEWTPEDWDLMEMAADGRAPSPAYSWMLWQVVSYAGSITLSDQP